MEAGNGSVIWITGLSGAGKTTLARALLPLLPEPSILLDGDEMREALTLVANGYDYESRKRLAHTYARLCKLVASQGAITVCATISLFHEVHAWNRENLPGYYEVFLDISEEQRLARDYKQVYEKNAPGENKFPVMGRELSPEFPQYPDITILDHSLQPEKIAGDIYYQWRKTTGKHQRSSRDQK